MKWPFQSIKKQSEWPFHGLLVELAVSIVQVPPEMKTPYTLKTIERCVRLAAKLAVEFKVPPCVVMGMCEEQLCREGGVEFESHLAAHNDDVPDHTADVQGKDALVKLLTGFGAAEPKDEEPN